MVQQGTARLGATQMQNINVHIPKLSYEKEDNSRDRLSVMSSVTHCDSQESQGRSSTVAGESCLNWVWKM